MKLFARILAGALLLAGVAQAAQLPPQQIGGVGGLIDTQLPTNQSNTISAASLRGVLHNILDSVPWATAFYPIGITASSYSFQQTDQAGDFSFQAAGAVALSLPHPVIPAPTTLTPYITNGWWVVVSASSQSTLTLTPSATLINGASSLTILPSQTYLVASNGSIYFATQLGGGTGGGGGLGALPTAVSGVVNSGGVPYFSSSVQMATSGVLGANQVVLGGGAGQPPYTVATDPLMIAAFNNPNTVINGVTCLLGGVCTLPASASVTVGVTNVVGGSLLGILWDNGGVLDEFPVTGGGSVVLNDSALITNPVIFDPSIRSSFTATGLVKNSDLVNPVITINTIPCSLGSSCSITAATTSITIGTTTVAGGSGGILGEAAGLLTETAVTGTGNVVQATSPSIASPTITGAFTATGLVTNADLLHSFTTVNGQTCSLGSACTITAAAGLVVGSSTISSGVSGRIEFNNSGVLGEKTTTGGGAVVLNSAPVITLQNGTNLPISTGVDGLGGGVAAALAAPIGSSGAVVLNGYANVSGSNLSTTGGCFSANHNITIISAQDFVNGQGIALEGCGTTFTGSAPTALAVSATGLSGQGPVGSTTYAYQIACVDAAGGVGAAVTQVQITNGAATLGTVTHSGTTSGVAFNNVSWTTSCPAVAVWRNSAAAGYHLIAVSSLSKIYDAGMPTLVVPFIPDTPTGSALNDRLVTSIVSGGGTTTLNLAAAPAQSLAGATVRHDDTSALAAAMALTPAVSLPAGTYNVENLTLSGISSFKGAGRGSTSIVGWSTSGVLLEMSSPSGAGQMISSMTVSPFANAAVTGVDITSATKCQVSNLLVNGLIGISLNSDTACDVFDNTIAGFGQVAIEDQTGLHDMIHDNRIEVGLMPPMDTAIFVIASTDETVQNNLALGGVNNGIVFQAGVAGALASGNSIYASYKEALHVSGAATSIRMENNYINGMTSSIGNCMSVSDDGVTSAISAVSFHGNWALNCGSNGIAVSQVAASGVTIGSSVIDGNTLINDNRNGLVLATVFDIAINGTGVHPTYVNGNTFLGSGASVSENIAEFNTNGAPSQTQVGANFGTVGGTGNALLIGSGSVKLTGGGTGL